MMFSSTSNIMLLPRLLLLLPPPAVPPPVSAVDGSSSAAAADPPADRRFVLGEFGVGTSTAKIAVDEAVVGAAAPTLEPVGIGPEVSIVLPPPLLLPPLLADELRNCCVGGCE